MQIEWKKGAERVWTVLRRDVVRIRPLVALVTCVGVLLSYITAIYITGPFHETSKWMGAMLAATSTIVVLKMPGGYRESLRPGWMRVLGTFLGALVAFVYLIFWHFTLVGMLVSVFVLEAVSMLTGIYSNDRISTITLVIILFISRVETHISPAVNCLLRFVESAVGVGIGIGLVWVLEQLDRWRKRRKSREMQAK